jgi:aminoglycoside phosphotransferase (APT) family kinase protein
VAAIVDAVAHLAAGDPEAAFVRDRAAALAEPFADAAAGDPLGHALVHGDLHGDNVVVGPAGPLLTDLELSGVGPAGYDAAPAALAVRRYGHDPETLATFLEAFGADPRGWAGFATYVAVYELWVTAWAVGVRDQDPSWAAEASRRVATLRDDTDERWVLR